MNLPYRTARDGASRMNYYVAARLGEDDVIHHSVPLNLYIEIVMESAPDGLHVLKERSFFSTSKSAAESRRFQPRSLISRMVSRNSSLTKVESSSRSNLLVTPSLKRSSTAEPKLRNEEYNRLIEDDGVPIAQRVVLPLGR